MPVTIRISGPQGSGKSQVGVKVTDFLRREGLMVASIYENSDNMPPAARKIWDTLLVDTDVIVYAFEETE